MEGVLYLKKSGIVKSWKKYYAVLDEQEEIFVLLKKDYQGK